MNVVIFEEADFVGEGRVALAGRRALHIVKVLKPRVGDCLRVGRLNGDMGSGVVVELSSSNVLLEVELNRSPPPPSPVGKLKFEGLQDTRIRVI